LTRKAIMPLFILMLLMVPVAQCFTIDGPTNFVNSHGGNVRFANAVVSAQISVIDTITRFGTLVVGGANRGNLAFDCDTGSVMVITGVTGTTVQYTITAVGQVDSYVYFGANLYEPVGTNTDAVVYDALTGITTVTTTGNVAVTLTYTVSAAERTSLNNTIAIAYVIFGIGVIAASGYATLNGVLDIKSVFALIAAWALGAVLVATLLTI